MFINEYLKAYNNYLTSGLVDFGVMGKSYYVEQLEFKRVVQHRAELFFNKDLFSNVITTILDEENITVSKWGIHGWRRGGIRDSNDVGMRKFSCTLNKDLNKLSAETFKFKYVDLVVNNAIFFNNMDIAETVEEFIKCWFDDRLKLNVSFPLLQDKLSVYAHRIGDTEFNKLDTETYGSVTMVSFDQKFSFPIPFDFKKLPLIRQIYLKFLNSVTSEVMSETIIE